MAQLNSVVGSILRDMVIAQHEANLYAISLMDLYGDNGVLQKFPLPGIALGEIDFDMRCAFVPAEGDGQNSPDEQSEIDYLALAGFMKDASAKYASTMFLCSIESIDRVLQNGDGYAENPLGKLSGSLGSEYVTFLSRKILDALRRNILKFLDTSTGLIDPEALSGIVCDTVVRNISGNVDMVSIFDKFPDMGNILAGDLRYSVGSLSESLASQAAFARKRLLPSANVVVSASELAKLPGDSLQKISMRISAKDIRIIDNSEDDKFIS